MEANLDPLRYPIGKFKAPDDYTAEGLQEYIRMIEKFPVALRNAVEGLSDEQLDTAYRDGGWTIRQVVHHVADSHMNAYIRFKLALTEDNPTIKPYHEERWADLEEARRGSIQLSLPLIDGLHKRWVAFLKTLTTDDFKRTFHHPESNADAALNRTAAIYAWHCDHHLAHITELKKRMGW